MAETLQPLGPNQERWLKALESGEFSQTKSELCNHNGYCCLGVGCALFFPSAKSCVHIDDVGDERILDNWLWFGQGEEAPQQLVDVLGLRGTLGDAITGFVTDRLSELNDNGTTFSEIAAIIRRDPSIYFREPR